MQEQGKHSNRTARLVALLIAVALVSSGVTAFFCGLWGGGAWAPLAQMADTIARAYYYYDEKVGGEDALVDAALRGMVSEPRAAEYIDQMDKS